MISKKGKFWEVGIWLFYVGFVTFVLGCVAFVAFRRYDLVEADYYEKGLAYQKQLGKIQPAPNERPTIAYDTLTEILSLTFQETAAAIIDSGSILFFRPADSRQDFLINLRLESNDKQQIHDNRLGKGYWRLKINWHSEGKNYYYEDVLLVR